MVLTALQNRVSNVDYIIVFQWPDGSFLRFKFVKLDTVTGTIDVVPEYAEDGDGNVIHTQQNASGQLVLDLPPEVSPAVQNDVMLCHRLVLSRE